MKLKIAILLAATVMLSSCGDGLTPEQRAARSAKHAERDAAWKNREDVTYHGNSYQVALNPDRTKMYVAAVGPKFKHSINDLNAVAKKATGCSGNLDAGVLVVLGAGNDSDMSIVTSVEGTSPPIWEVGLKC